MDRELSETIIQKQRLRNIAWAVLATRIIMTGLYFFRSSLSTSLNHSKIRLATTEVGNIENTMNVFGLENGVYVKAILLSVLMIYLLVIICAFYPSWQASRIHPAIALHAE